MTIIKNILNISSSLDSLRMGKDDINIIQTLKLDSNIHETSHSRALKEFLSLGKSYNYPFLKLFFSEVGLNKMKDFTPTAFYCERQNIDILILGKSYGLNVAIIIENKINEATDQENQIGRYIEIAQKQYHCQKENIFTIYLTSGLGKIYPTENSISIEERVRLEKSGNFIPITYHKHILNFLDTILTTWNNESIRTAAFQYQEYIKIRLGINNKEKGYREMEKNKVKEELKKENLEGLESVLSFINSINETYKITLELAQDELCQRFDLTSDIHEGYTTFYLPINLEKQDLKLKIYFENPERGKPWCCIRLAESTHKVNGSHIEKDLQEKIRSHLKQSQAMNLSNADNEHNPFWIYIENQGNPIDELVNYIENIISAF